MPHRKLIQALQAHPLAQKLLHILQQKKGERGAPAPASGDTSPKAPKAAPDVPSPSPADEALDEVCRLMHKSINERVFPGCVVAFGQDRPDSVRGGGGGRGGGEGICPVLPPAPLLSA